MEQNIVKLQISNEYIQGSGVSVGAVGSHDDVLLEMDFRPSAVWAGTTRRAIFANALGENRTVIVLTTNLLEEGQGEIYLVPVPQQAKDVAGECFLTVEGFVTDGTGKEIVRCVTEEARFRVLPSKLYTNDSAPVTPSQAEQLQAEIDSIKTTIVNAGISERNAKASEEAAAYSEQAAQSSKEFAQAFAARADASKDEAQRQAAAAANYAAAAERSRAATMENVRRIRDFTFRDEEGNRTGDVKTIIERVFGRNGNAYLNKLVDDINQGVRSNGTGNLTDGLVGNYKAAAVAANIRVILQQPTAILRAMNTLDPKYLIAGTVKRGDWGKVKKYAPIAVWKDWGYFDINTGRQMKDVLLSSDTMMEKVKQAAMAGAGKADSFAWARLWNAVEAETKDKRPGLKPGTDEFYKAVASRFGEIIDGTQVVDGLLQRSQIMRSPDALTKMSTSFMGEPTKTYNMFVNAVYDLRNAEGKEARTKAKRGLARTTTALVVSFAVNAVMQSIVDALRDDDKERDYWEKMLTAYTGFTGDEETFLDYWNSFWDGNLEANFNPMGYLPYFKDMLSIAQGYDVSRMDMEPISKVWDAAVNMKKALSGEGKYSLAGASANLLAEAARLLGIPVANLKRDIQAGITTAAIETDSYLMQYRIDKAMLNMGYSGNTGNFMDILYNASINDREAYEIIYADMVASGISEDKISNAMETRMKRDQGVESVADLEARYLTPKQEQSYNSLRQRVTGTTVWSAASAEQREALEEDLYDLTVANSSGLKLQEKIDGGAAYGIDEADYLLYRLALHVVDHPSESGKMGSYTGDEVQSAIDMLTGLDDEARAYLWEAAGKSENSNPYK